MPLAVVIRSGTTPSCSQANQSPVRQKPDWISSAMKTMPCSRQNSASAAMNPSGGHDEAALALDRLEDHGGDVVLADLGVDQGLDRLERLGLARLRAARPAQRVGHRHPVDLARERAEALLVGHVLGGQRHRQVGAAVVGVIERDHRRPPGVVAGDLHRVLDRLGARVEQRGALLVGARRAARELLADLHVPLVRGDHEAGVGELRDLLLHAADDGVGRVADRRDGDAGAEVDQRVAVGVEHHAAAGGGDEDGQRGRDAARDGAVAALHQGARGGSGDLGDKVTALRQLRAANGERGHDRTITSTDA